MTLAIAVGVTVILAFLGGMAWLYATAPDDDAEWEDE